jgi:hypothetical protein
VKSQVPRSTRVNQAYNTNEYFARTCQNILRTLDAASHQIRKTNAKKSNQKLPIPVTFLDATELRWSGPKELPPYPDNCNMQNIREK